MKKLRKISLLFTIISLYSCSNGVMNNSKDIQIENKFYPLASQKSILLAQDSQASSIDIPVDYSALGTRDKNCNLQDTGEISDISSIVNIYGNLLATPSAGSGYNYQYEVILAKTKDLIDQHSCYYPEIYLANASILLRLSEIPTDLLNSENRLIQSTGLNPQEENNFSNQTQSSDDLKFSKFAKLNSVIREAQTATALIQADIGKKFTRISAPNSSGQIVNLFESQFNNIDSADPDKFAEANIYANYLLAKARYERAIYRLQGIVSSDDLYNTVEIPNDIPYFGTTATVREVIAEEFKQASTSVNAIYQSTFCDTNALNTHLPAHMSSMCGDLKNIVGNDLSIVTKTLDNVTFDNPFYLKLGRLVCSADSRYTPHEDEVKFCQNFLTQFPSAKNANLNENGIAYSSINSWALNLAGVTQHLSYLDNALTTVINNIVQNKDSILATQDVNNKLTELNAQKSSLTDTESIAQNNIATAQDNIHANQAAVSSAQAAVSALQNQLITATEQQGSVFRDYLSDIRKEQYITFLLNTLSDKQTAVDNFKNTFTNLSKSSSDTLNNELAAVQKEWVGECSQNILEYNNNIDLLTRYKCIVDLTPGTYWKDKTKWSDVTSQDYINVWKQVEASITDPSADECKIMEASAAMARQSQLIMDSLDPSPYKTSNLQNYVSDMASFASAQQNAKDAIAQLNATQAQFAFIFNQTNTTQKINADDLQKTCNDFIAEDYSGYSAVKNQIIQNDISTAAQTMSNQITLDNIAQDQTTLQSNLDDLKTQISELAEKLSLDKNTRGTYETNPSIVFSYTQDQIDAEVTKYTNSLSNNSPAIKAIQDQITAANYEVTRAQSLLDAANSQLTTANLNLLSVQNSIAQLNLQIQNWDTTKNSFVFSALMPSMTSYFNKEYLLSDAQESAQSLLKVLAYRTMSFDAGLVSGPNYSQFLKLLDSAQLQCRYFASFGDAEKCILSLRNILDPSVAKVNFGLYGSHTEILPIQIYSDDYYNFYSDIDKRTPVQTQMNNKIIQDLKNIGVAVLPLNSATLAMEFDQGASISQILNEFGTQRVLGVSVNIIKRDEAKIKDLTYSQDQNKIAILRDGLSDLSAQQNDCTAASVFANAQSQNTKKILANNNYDIRLQNLIAPDIMTNIICQKVSWVEKPQTDSIPDTNLIYQNSADKKWIIDLKNKTNHDYRPFFKVSDGPWNRISGLISPDPLTNTAANYNNVMLGCLNDAIQNPTASNLSLVRCNSSPVTSTIDFTNIAGNSLMGNWNIVYGEYGADTYDYNAETQSGKVSENDKTRIIGLNIVFYIIKN